MQSAAREPTASWWSCSTCWAAPPGGAAAIATAGQVKAAKQHREP